MESQFRVSFPLFRKAFESISLLAACAVDAGLAETWASGKEVPNVKVRQRLSNDPIQEPLESTRELYRYFGSWDRSRKPIVKSSARRGCGAVMPSWKAPELRFTMSLACFRMAKRLKR